MKFWGRTPSAQDVFDTDMMLFKVVMFALCLRIVKKDFYIS